MASMKHGEEIMEEKIREVGYGLIHILRRKLRKKKESDEYKKRIKTEKLKNLEVRKLEELEN